MNRESGAAAMTTGARQRAASLTEARRAFRQRGHYICVMASARTALVFCSVFLNKSSGNIPALPDR
ncbi:hypothetical protein VSR17_06305 [Cupriavidus taiwanensis]|uniref:hypothetical protein n=1 Tax=Cupriavidus taiwanensis TaxID=164546 RepID=UPI0011C031A3|nr:hypothetical protein [Cupriavidus taiwanensis]